MDVSECSSGREMCRSSEFISATTNKSGFAKSALVALETAVNTPEFLCCSPTHTQQHARGVLLFFTSKNCFVQVWRVMLYLTQSVSCSCHGRVVSVIYTQEICELCI